MSKHEIAEKSVMIIDGIAFEIEKKDNALYPYLRVIDVGQQDYMALYAVKADGDFDMLSSSFIKGERQSEMLDYLERNKDVLMRTAYA